MGKICEESEDLKSYYEKINLNNQETINKLENQLIIYKKECDVDKNEIIGKLNKTEFEKDNINKEKQEIINKLKFELMELKNKQDEIKNEKHKICEESEDLKSYYEQINLNNQETIDKLGKQLNIYKKECDVDKNEIIEKLNKTEFEKDNINKENKK